MRSDFPKIIIAIDGYSSTGKSTFAKQLAALLNYLYVDTGALYRGVTYYAINKKTINSKKEINLEKLQSDLLNLILEFRNDKSGKSYLMCNGQDIEKEIRTLEVSEMVSYIAKIEFVRNFVDNILHQLGKSKGVIMDGRDIGTAVFPNAELKIFMTAEPEVRALRRYTEMIERGEQIEFSSVLNNIKERDFIDENREVAPLKRANDAIILDNSNMTIEDQLNWICKIIETKWILE